MSPGERDATADTPSNPDVPADEGLEREKVTVRPLPGTERARTQPGDDGEPESDAQVEEIREATEGASVDPDGQDPEGEGEDGAAVPDAQGGLQ